jgi:hypothetical protein
MAGWIGALREAAWFTPRRALNYSWLLAGFYYAPVLAVALVYTYRHGGTPDFQAFWAAAKLAWENPALAWDSEQLRHMQGWTPGRGWMPFVNPPPFLLLVAPLGLLPIGAAHLLWVAATLAIYIAAVRRLLPLGPALAFTPVFLNVLVGQNGLLCGALLIGGLTQLERRPFLAGVLIGALVIKPQIAVLVPIAFLAGRQWRAIAGAAAGALGSLGLSLALLGPAAFQAFWAATRFASFNLQSGANASKMESLFSSLVAAGAPGPIAWGAQLAATGAVAALVFLAWRRPGDLLGKGALLAAAAPLASPYFFNYDLAVWALPIAWLAREGTRRGFFPWERLTIALAFVWPVASEPLAHLMGECSLGPLVAPILVAAVHRRLLGAASDQRLGAFVQGASRAASAAQS